MDHNVEPPPAHQARGPVRPIGLLIVRSLIAVLAALGLVVPTAAAHAHIGTVVAVATAADDAPHAGSIDATADAAVARSSRRRQPVRVLGAAGRLVRAMCHMAVTSWTVPARIVGGVPPGRAPPASATPFAGVGPLAA